MAIMWRFLCGFWAVFSGFLFFRWFLHTKQSLWGKNGILISFFSPLLFFKAKLSSQKMGRGGWSQKMGRGGCNNASSKLGRRPALESRPARIGGRWSCSWRSSSNGMRNIIVINLTCWISDFRFTVDRCCRMIFRHWWRWSRVGLQLTRLRSFLYGFSFCLLPVLFERIAHCAM